MGFLDATGITTLVRRLNTKFALKSGDTFTGDISIETSGGASISLLDSDGYSTTISPSTGWISGNKTINLPPYSGTLATTSQIPSVPSIVDVTSEALTVGSSSIATIGNLKLYSYGDFRILMGYITAVGMTTSQQTVANIAEGHRPAAQTAIACSWDSGRYNTWAIVGTGGAIAVRSGSAYTSGNLRMNAIWVVA